MMNPVVYCRLLLVLVQVLFFKPVVWCLSCSMLLDKSFLSACDCRYDHVSPWVMYSLNGTFDRDVNFTTDFQYKAYSSYSTTCQRYNGSGYTIECPMPFAEGSFSYRPLILSAIKNNTVLASATFRLNPRYTSCQCNWNDLLPNLALEKRISSLQLDWFFVNIQYPRKNMEFSSSVYLNRSGSITNVENCSNIQFFQDQECTIPIQYLYGNDPYDICVEVSTRLCFQPDAVSVYDRKLDKHVRHVCIQNKDLVSNLFQAYTVSNEKCAVNGTNLTFTWKATEKTTTAVYYYYSVFGEFDRLITSGVTNNTEIAFNLSAIANDPQNVKLALQLCWRNKVCSYKTFISCGTGKSAPVTEAPGTDYTTWLLTLLILTLLLTFGILAGYCGFVRLKIRNRKIRTIVIKRSPLDVMDTNTLFVIPNHFYDQVGDPNRFKTEVDFDKIDLRNY